MSANCPLPNFFQAFLQVTGKEIGVYCELSPDVRVTTNAYVALGSNLSYEYVTAAFAVVSPAAKDTVVLLREQSGCISQFYGNIQSALTISSYKRYQDI
mgnify:CR=1 FL=1